MSGNNQESIKAIADALKKGGTLLDAACPVCNSPLIKIEGRVFCKVCNKEVIIYKDESQLPPAIQKALKRNAYSDLQGESNVEKTIKGKIESLRKKLEETDNPDEIIKISEAIDKLVSTLKKINEEID